MFLLVDRPIRNKRLHIKNSLLEVKCERQALFVSPSIHKDGNPYSTLDTGEKIQRIIPNLELDKADITDSLPSEFHTIIDIMVNGKTTQMNNVERSCGIGIRS